MTFIVGCVLYSLKPTATTPARLHERPRAPCYHGLSARVKGGGGYCKRHLPAARQRQPRAYRLHSALAANSPH